MIHDYVSFYFGYLSPMMFQLKTGRVPGYNEGQEPLIYLMSTCQEIQKSDSKFVFSDGHGIAAYTKWYEDLKDLDEIDWDVVYKKYWADDLNDLDRQRRKQAEFLIYRVCDWSLISDIVVINHEMKNRVEMIMKKFDEKLRRPVTIKRNWYY